MSSVDFWNTVYGSGEVQLPKDDAPVLQAALAHFGDVRGKKLLDLGCGRGEISFFFASRGAEVTSLDTSPAAVKNMEAFCAKHQIANIHPVQQTAMAIDGLGPFDFVVGSMILHHIEPFADFAKVLRAALAPSGRAFFYENSAASELLIWFRTHVVGKLWVPKTSDDEEFPLMPSEVNELRRHFDVRIEHPELFFFRLISMCLLRGALPGPFLWMDKYFHQYAWLRRYSYRQYVILNAR